MAQHRIHIVFSTDFTEAIVTHEIWLNGERTHALVCSPEKRSQVPWLREALRRQNAAFPPLWLDPDPLDAA